MRILEIKNLALRNLKVIENYFFMTALQIISSLFGIIIYPYLIRTLGANSYGLYVFAFSVASYFISFISFGFDFPALKGIVENKNDLCIKSKIVSSIFSAKLYLSLVTLPIFLVLLSTIPIMKQNWIIFLFCYVQIIGEILFPIWYFQGIQKMKIVTFIQLGFRILTLPFIFIFVKYPDDCWIYSLIISVSIILGGAVSSFYLKFNDKITINLVSFNSLRIYFKDALPFFWSNSTGVLKQESVTLIIGAFFGMKEVALYDLAKKIIIIPRMLTMSINAALFPKIVDNIQKSVIRKIIRYETIIGMIVIVGVTLFGYWMIILLGGKSMSDSYPLAIILSFTVLVWLVVGSYINFIFIPNNQYYFVTRNQIVAFLSFFILAIPSVLYFNSFIAVIASLSISGLCEIIYCNYLIKKHNLL